MFKFRLSKISKEKQHLYFIANDNLDNNFDSDIAEYLGLTIEKYSDILINKFNGNNLFSSNEDIYFDNEIDCQNAVNYLNENLDNFLVFKELTR